MYIFIFRNTLTINNSNKEKTQLITAEWKKELKFVHFEISNFFFNSTASSADIYNLAQGFLI